MKEILLQNIPFSLNFEKIKKDLYINEGSEDIERIKEIIKEVENIAKPKGIYKVSFIQNKGNNSVIIDGTKFHSHVLRHNLNNVNRVFPFVATCGTELDQWSNKFEDILENYWVDYIKELILRDIVKFLCNDMKKRFGLDKVSSMNPGSLEDWPITEQKSLFSIIGNVDDLIGVSLTESFLMIPSKTVSGIYFTTQTNYNNCKLCPRQNCPTRKLPFDSELYKKMFIFH